MIKLEIKRIMIKTKYHKQWVVRKFCLHFYPSQVYNHVKQKYIYRKIRIHTFADSTVQDLNNGPIIEKKNLKIIQILLNIYYLFAI